jgi:hypothetical protein
LPQWARAVATIVQHAFIWRWTDIGRIQNLYFSWNDVSLCSFSQHQNVELCYRINNEQETGSSSSLEQSYIGTAHSLWYVNFHLINMLRVPGPICKRVISDSTGISLTCLTLPTSQTRISQRGVSFRDEQCIDLYLWRVIHQEKSCKNIQTEYLYLWLISMECRTLFMSPST